MELSEAEKGYLAGIMDGEGSVLIYRNSADRVIRLVIQTVTTTSPLIFEKVRSLLEKADFRPGIRIWKGDTERGWNRAGMLDIRRIDQQKDFIRQVGPYVIGKAEHLKLASIFLARRASGSTVKPNAEDELLIARVKQLNARGRKRSRGSVTTERGALERVKSQSELHREMQRATEMIAPPLFKDLHEIVGRA